MSIFSDFLSPMKDIFSIENRGYQYKQSIIQAPIACSKMMGWDYFRDPSTIPLARGMNLPREMLMDFVVDDNRFDCLVDGKRQWVMWSDIFDKPISNINDIFDFALDGEFDATLPMWEETEPIEVEHDSALEWYHVWEIKLDYPHHNTSKYWNIVSHAIIENFKKHIKPGIEVEITGGTMAAKDFYDHKRHLEFQMKIISIHGLNCCWLNTMQAALDILHHTHYTKYYSPCINFMCEIAKNKTENIDINLSYN